MLPSTCAFVSPLARHAFGSRGLYDFRNQTLSAPFVFIMSSPGQNRSFHLGSSHRAMLELNDLLDDRGIMNFDQNSPGVGKARTPAPFLDRPSWNWLSVRIWFGSRPGRNLTPLVSKELVLDFVERSVVLILFLYFA